jgi:hypothetical protein
LPCKRQEFDSPIPHCFKQHQLGLRSGLMSSKADLGSPGSAKYPCRGVWSPRLLVKQKIAGSNPARGACRSASASLESEVDTKLPCLYLAKEEIDIILGVSMFSRLIDIAMCVLCVLAVPIAIFVCWLAG